MQSLVFSFPGDAAAFTFWSAASIIAEIEASNSAAAALESCLLSQHCTESTGSVHAKPYCWVGVTLVFGWCCMKPGIELNDIYRSLPTSDTLTINFPGLGLTASRDTATLIWKDNILHIQSSLFP